ncbi:hypothetical protein SRHO_G00232370 [Serrasalmus rhombeus]
MRVMAGGGGPSAWGPLPVPHSPRFVAAVCSIPAFLPALAAVIVVARGTGACHNHIDYDFSLAKTGKPKSRLLTMKQHYCFMPLGSPTPVKRQELTQA